jgi:disulfide bond formation protein DsbB
VAVLAFSMLVLLLRRSRAAHSRVVGAALLAASGVALLVGAGIAAFHVGVEQHWWAGTAGCGVTSAATSLEELRAQVLAAPVTRCDEVPWALFGISMAGYNTVIALALSVFAFAAARTAFDGSPVSRKTA